MARILVVSAKKEEGDMLGIMLASLGHEADVLYDSQEAISSIPGFPKFGAIFASFEMPGILGSSVAALAKKANEAIKVVLIASSNATKEQFVVADYVIHRGNVFGLRTISQALAAIGL